MRHEPCETSGCRRHRHPACSGRNGRSVPASRGSLEGKIRHGFPVPRSGHLPQPGGHDPAGWWRRLAFIESDLPWGDPCSPEERAGGTLLEPCVTSGPQRIPSEFPGSGVKVPAFGCLLCSMVERPSSLACSRVAVPPRWRGGLVRSITPAVPSRPGCVGPRRLHPAVSAGTIRVVRVPPGPALGALTPPRFLHAPMGASSSRSRHQSGSGRGEDAESLDSTSGRQQQTYRAIHAWPRAEPPRAAATSPPAAGSGSEQRSAGTRRDGQGTQPEERSRGALGASGRPHEGARTTSERHRSNGENPPEVARVLCRMA